MQPLTVIQLALAGLLLTGAAGAQTPPRRRPVPRPLEPLFTVEPKYTPEASQAHLQGSAILYLEINLAGRVERVSAIQSLGMGLDESAAQAVLQWRFKPDTIPGRGPVYQSAEIPFSLNPGPSWRILRAGYRISGKGSRIDAEPVLSAYRAPADQPCLAGGGPVVAQFEIDKQGKPGHIRITEEHGAGSGEAIAGAAADWRFQPGAIDGKAAKFDGIFELSCGTQTAPTEAVSLSVAEEAPSAAAPDRDLEAGVYRVGRDVKAPSPSYRPEPYYSEEARKARYQGTVVMYVEVDSTGHASHLRVVRSLGLGLDQKAMQSVSQWRFKPGTKDGNPVTVAATIEVNFRLL